MILFRQWLRSDIFIISIAESEIVHSSVSLRRRFARLFEKIDAIPWKVLILIGVVLLAIGLLVGIKFINFILVFAGFFLIFTGIQNRKK